MYICFLSLIIFQSNVNSGLSALQREHESRYKAAQRDYIKAAADLAELKSEVLKAIRGQSRFLPDILNGLIVEAEKELFDIANVRDMAKQELDGCKYKMEAQYSTMKSFLGQNCTMRLTSRQKR